MYIEIYIIMHMLIQFNYVKLVPEVTLCMLVG